MTRFNLSLITLVILFLMICLSYIPDFITKITDRYSYYSEMKSSFEEIEQWKSNKNELRLNERSLATKVSLMSVDIPKTDNPIDLIQIINDHASHNAIKNLEHTFGKFKRSGNYMFRKMTLQFKAHYKQGITFLHALETDRSLIILKSIDINNEKNRVNRPIDFSVSLELVLNYL